MTEKKKKDVLMMSYRPISGYSSKEYKTESGGSLIILSGAEKSLGSGSISTGHKEESDMYTQARVLMERIKSKAIKQLEQPKFARVIIYSGLYAKLESLRFAEYVKETFGIIPELVVCSCDIDTKKQFSEDLESKLTLSECGGAATMGSIADDIMKG